MSSHLAWGRVFGRSRCIDDTREHFWRLFEEEDTIVPTTLSISSSFIYLLIFGCVGSLLLCENFSSCSGRELLFIGMRGLHIAVASFVVEHGASPLL